MWVDPHDIGGLTHLDQGDPPVAMFFNKSSSCVIGHLAAEICIRYRCLTADQIVMKDW